jgi:hypothetical protein
VLEPENEREQALTMAASEPSRRLARENLYECRNIRRAYPRRRSARRTGRESNHPERDVPEISQRAVPHDDDAHMAFYTAPSRARIYAMTIMLSSREDMRSLRRNSEMAYQLNVGSD